MTAENLAGRGAGSAGAACFNEAAADDRGKRPPAAIPDDRAHASMRPRPMTAENELEAVKGDRRALASMRPRPMTAENDAPPPTERRRTRASMRPRPMTAENGPVGVTIDAKALALQ